MPVLWPATGVSRCGGLGGREQAPPRQFQNYQPASGGPTLKPAAGEPGGELLFRIDPLRLFDREGQRSSGRPWPTSGRRPPFNGEIRGLTHLARGEFGRLLFGAPLGGCKLRPERFDMGLERPHPEPGLAGEPTFVHDAGAQRASSPRSEPRRSNLRAAESAFACRFRASFATGRAWPVAGPPRSTRSTVRPPACR